MEFFESPMRSAIPASTPVEITNMSVEQLVRLSDIDTELTLWHNPHRNSVAPHALPKIVYRLPSGAPQLLPS